MSNFEPRFEARPSGPLDDGLDIHVFWTFGKFHLVKGFSTQYEALDWIKCNEYSLVRQRLRSGPPFFCGALVANGT